MCFLCAFCVCAVCARVLSVCVCCVCVLCVCDLKVVELPSSNAMTNDYEAHGAGFAVPNWERTADDDERQKWFFDPPGDGAPLSLAIR